MNFDQLISSPWLWASLAAGASAWALGLARSAPMQLFRLIKSKMYVTITLSDDDKLFHQFLSWLHETNRLRQPRAVVATFTEGTSYHAAPTASPTPYGDSAMTQGGGVAAPDSQPVIAFTPAPGMHFFRYNGKMIQLDRRREKLEQGRGFREELTIRMFTLRLSDASDMLTECVHHFKKTETVKRIPVYMRSGREWAYAGDRRARSLDSVILPAGQVETLTRDVEKFLSMEQWYADHGIPYKRGYLFHGTPGSGKSSLAVALAGHLGYSLAIINIGDKYLQDDALMMTMSQLREGTVVLFEDIDAAFRGRDHVNKDAYLTFSGLLNALDGVMLRERLIAVITTNHIEQLDPALVRPGRVDFKMEFEDATQSQVARLFDRNYPNADAHTKVDFVRWGTGLSMARLQESVIRHPEDAAAATRSLLGEYVKNGQRKTEAATV